MFIVKYDRIDAVNYALEWALKRNRKYADFSNMGGDCTNFISQCIYAGSKVMNYDKKNPWYYNSINSRSPSWTSVMQLHRFITTNNAYGPFGKECSSDETQLGDIVQLSNDRTLYTHSLFITKIDNGNIYVSTHTLDSVNKNLNRYKQKYRRYTHIEGVRKV